MVKRNKTKEISFAYDPFGRRISKIIEKEEFADEDDNQDNGNHNGNDKDNYPDKDKGGDKHQYKHNDYPRITYYVYDEQNIIAEYDQNGKQTASYIHGPNIDEPLAAEIRNNRIYYHADGLGTITALTNHMGITVQKYDYDSFGNIKFTPFPHWIKQPYTYIAREFDSETGLYYYRARYYDPKAGRFITKDPIGFGGGINKYAYVKNNPLRYVDSFGLWGWDVHFFMTFRIASQIPKLECYAYAIASKDQLVDEDERSLIKWGIYKPWNLKWHFPELGRVTHLLNKACLTCTAYDIGGALHVAQDAIAHAGYSYGHPLWVDDVTRRPYEAQLTYKYTTDNLELISRFCDKIL